MDHCVKIHRHLWLQARHQALSPVLVNITQSVSEHQYPSFSLRKSWTFDVLPDENHSVLGRAFSPFGRARDLALPCAGGAETPFRGMAAWPV
jgi:hypothetical protein